MGATQLESIADFLGLALTLLPDRGAPVWVLQTNTIGNPDKCTDWHKALMISRGRYVGAFLGHSIN